MHDVAAERAVLAGAARYGSDFYMDISDIVGVKAFQDISNQVIWACIDSVLKKEARTQLDYPTIMSAANSLGLGAAFSSTEEQRHLLAILNMPVTRENAGKLAGKLVKLNVMRELSDKLEEGRARLKDFSGDEPIDVLVGAAESPLLDYITRLNAISDNNIVSMGEGAEDYYRELVKNPNDLVGIPSGFARWDRAIGGGFQEGSFDVIAARAKTGKSWLVDRIGLNVAMSGYPVLNLDTEMSKKQHLHRIGAMLTGLPLWDIRRGKVMGREEDLYDAGRKLAKIPYDYWSIIGQPFEETVSNLRRWVKRKVGFDEAGNPRPALIIYDYLKLMDATSVEGMAEHQKIGYLATALKNFAGQHRLSVLALAQLNRDGLEKDDITALSQSDRITWYCTSLTYYRAKKESDMAGEDGPQPKFTHKLVYILSREGEGLAPGDYINVETDYRTGLIKEGPTRNQLGPQRPAATVPRAQVKRSDQKTGK